MGTMYEGNYYYKITTPICEKAFKHVDEPEIEVGDIVRIVKLEYGTLPTVLSPMAKMFGECVEVKDITPVSNGILGRKNHYLLSWIDDDGEKQEYWFHKDWIELVKKGEKNYSGHVVCIEYTGTCDAFTVGKVYKITNGKLIDNNRDPYCCIPIKSIEDLNARWACVRFIEYKGGADE